MAQKMLVRPHFDVAVYCYCKFSVDVMGVESFRFFLGKSTQNQPFKIIQIPQKFANYDRRVENKDFK